MKKLFYKLRYRFSKNFRDQEEYKKCTEDPVYFAEHYCRYMCDSGWVVGGLLEYQKDIIRSITDVRTQTNQQVDEEGERNIPFNKNIIWVSSREVRRTTTLATAILWLMIFRNSNIAYINKNQNFRELEGKMESMLVYLPDFFKMRFKVKSDNYWGFDSKGHHSKMLNINGIKEMIGKTFDVVIWDDFTDGKKSDYNEFVKNVYPCLLARDESQLILSSSAGFSSKNNNHDELLRIWNDSENGKNNFHRIFTPYNVIPGRDDEWIKNVKNSLGEKYFNAEFGSLD